MARKSLSNEDSRSSTDLGVSAHSVVWKNVQVCSRVPSLREIPL